jgi:hypothetical protein
MDHQHYYCDFCCMKIDFRIVKENHERLDVRFRDFALAAYIDKTTPETQGERLKNPVKCNRRNILKRLNQNGIYK